MPKLKIETFVTVVLCDRDTSITWDGGILRIKAGQYLGLLDYDAGLVVLDESDITSGTPMGPYETNDKVEIALLRAIERGRW